MPLLLPTTLDEALALKAETPVAVPVAGGTDYFVHWPERVERHDDVQLDLSGVRELGGVRWSDAALELGALSTYWECIGEARLRGEFPMLVEAARQVGAVQIQSRGTWAGNIANASPAADGVPVLMACDAVVVVASVRGERRIALDEFYRGYKEMDLEPDELITAIHVPRRRRPVQVFEKVGSRRAQAITKVGVAIAHSEAGWRVVANSVAPTVRRCRAVEARLEAGGALAGPEDLLEAIDADVAPIDDIRSTATYRRAVLARVLFSALRGGSATI